MKKDSLDPMDELHEIRYQHYEETKNLSPKQWAEQVNREAEEAIKKYKLHLKTPQKV